MISSVSLERQTFTCCILLGFNGMDCTRVSSSLAVRSVATTICSQLAAIIGAWH